jgi:phenylacetate-coenzyme A ligase PaaK-like adenylate-forming protein
MIDRRHGYFQRERETRSRENRDAVLKEKLSEILQHGYQHSRAIHSLFEKAGLMPDAVKELKDNMAAARKAGAEGYVLKTSWSCRTN